MTLTILDVLNGFLLDSISPIDAVSWPILLAAEVEDGCMLGHLDSKWDIEGQKLVDTIKNLGPLEALALFDFAGRFGAQSAQKPEEAVKHFRGVEPSRKSSG